MDVELTGPARKLVRHAKRQLVVETYAPVLASGLFAVFVFIIGASLGLWQRIGDPWRIIALITAVFFMARSLILAQRLQPPSLSDAKRRVEHDSDLEHRPLDTITDTPIKTETGEHTWKTHVKQAQSALLYATQSKRRNILAHTDKFYLRYITPIVLILAIMIGAGDNYERLRSSVLPVWQYGISAKRAHFEAWVDPPEYTGRPPSYFKTIETVNAPEGSYFAVRITDIKSTPRLLISDGKRTHRITPTRLGPKSFEARAKLASPSVASIRIANTQKQWGLNIGPDTPPLIDFVDQPKPSKRDKLILSYTLEDDFGVEELYLSMEYEGEHSEKIPVPLPGSHARTIDKERVSLDLTKHIWAGKLVKGRLLAVDGKKQVGSSQMAEFVVPDKIFIEPLAKSIAENRILFLNGNRPYTALKHSPKLNADAKNALYHVDRPDMAINRAPDSIQRIAPLLEVITDRPSDVFNDPAVYMGLRTIYRRVRLARSIEELSGLDQEFWDIALRAEFGLLGDALEDMRAAERALNTAMTRRAPQREVDVLFDRYNKAVDRYMEELMKKAIEDAKNNPQNGDGEGGAQADFQIDEIQKLLDAIEEANRMGDTAAARKALAQLAILLENMEIQLSQSGGSGDGGPSSPPLSEDLKEALEELHELLGDQRELRDETQEKNRAEADRQFGENTPSENGNTSPNQPGDTPSAQDLAQQQGALRKLLETLENQSNAKAPSQDGKEGAGSENTQNDQSGTGSDGEDEQGSEQGQSLADALNNEDVQDALERARRAMRNSEGLLESEDFYAAEREQDEAIDALREAGEQLFAEEAKRLKQEREREGRNGDLGQADPFGRENGVGGTDENIKVPEIDDQQRAYELLEELRRRSGEQDRDETERDYLDRLLERF